MAGGLDGVRAVKGLVLEWHSEEVALHRLAQRRQAELHARQLAKSQTTGVGVH